MPYLQLDVSNHYPVDVKRGVARRLGDEYAHIMQTTPDRPGVSRLGEGGVVLQRGGPSRRTAPCDMRRAVRPNNGELARAQ